jgi:hypothetical protein
LGEVGESMTTIQAENFEITIHDGSWRLIPTGDTLSREPVFQVTRGGGVMEYTPAFGETHKLPGTVLSVEYIRAVVIGYEDRTRRWLLGFHIARDESDKARWLELVQWPSGDNELYAYAAQQAGRELAEHLGCPLKIFGAKKLPPQQAADSARSGVTGPLVPHKREDIGPQRVKLFAQSAKLPVQYPGIWLGRAKTGVVLRLAKDVAFAKSGGVAPSFNQCVIDPEEGVVRLVPPTGLLGTFFGSQPGRVIKTSDVRNVELRHTVARTFVPQTEAEDLITEVTYTTYTWDVYLTLPDESLLLAQTTHATSSELLRKRATVGNKFSVDTKAGIEYLRQHQADQEAYEAAETFARTVGIVIASTLGVRLVQTEVEEG